MITAILLLQAASATPTVGDTIWLARTVEVPAGHSVRAPADSLGGPVELLGPPQLVRREGAVLVRYPAVAWEPGEHTVSLPGPVLVAPDGVEDSLPPIEVAVRVRSVLPAVPPDSALAVQPPTGIVLRRETTLLPALVLLGLGALLLAPLHWWWRRRGPRRAPEPAGTTAPAVPYARWADAGERRAVLAAAAARLRAAVAAALAEASPGLATGDLLAVVARHRPDLPLDELEAVLRDLDAGRFAPASLADPSGLAVQAAELAERIAGQPPAAAAPAEVVT